MKLNYNSHQRSHNISILRMKNTSGKIMSQKKAFFWLFLSLPHPQRKKQTNKQTVTFASAGEERVTVVLKRDNVLSCTRNQLMAYVHRNTSLSMHPAVYLFKIWQDLSTEKTNTNREDLVCGNVCWMSLVILLNDCFISQISNCTNSAKWSGDVWVSCGLWEAIPKKYSVKWNVIRE